MGSTNDCLDLDDLESGNTEARATRARTWVRKVNLKPPEKGLIQERQGESRGTELVHRRHESTESGKKEAETEIRKREASSSVDRERVTARRLSD
jgi:hypothetical protein